MANGSGTRAAIVRKLALLPIVGLLAVPVVLPSSASSPPSGAGRGAPPILSPEVFSAGLDADGEVVRRAPGVIVERLTPPALRAGERLWRVTVDGRFPPRAERYVVLAAERPIGYGVPTASQRSVQTVTSSSSVLTAPLSVRYGEEGVQSPSREVLHSPRVGPTRDIEPAAQGPLAVTRREYDLGDEVFRPSRFRRGVELVANVHHPKDLSAGPYPLVVFMHGNHSTCYRKKKSAFRWPCRPGWRPLPNYAGYDYIARPLASQGFIVVSISANGVNVHGSRLRDTGMRQRGELLDEHIDLWRAWSTGGEGPFDDTFVGAVDLSLIGTMGHSRGGEGVVWHKIVDEERPDPYGIDAVLALAPVDFTRATINDTSFAVVLPTCDGDVSDLQGVHFFDDSRYLVPGDPTPKHTVTAFQANHNFFNTVWSPSSKRPGSFDDGAWSSCRQRLNEWQQRRMGGAYIAGFFRRYLGGESSLNWMWTGAATPASISPARALVNYLAPDIPTHRLDLGRFTDATDLFTSEVGGAVVPDRLSAYGWCANTFKMPCIPGRFAFNDIHLTSLSQAAVGWSNRAAQLRFELPQVHRDVGRFDAFQLRVAVNPAYDANEFRFQDLVVALVDGEGHEVEVAASDVGNAALAHPMRGDQGNGGHVILNQLRFPLDRFEGVDLGNVHAVEVRMSARRSGVVNIADVAFSHAPD